MRHLAVFLLACLSAVASLAAPLEVRYVPQRGLYAYDLDAARRLSAVLAQNIAVIWRGPGTMSLEAIELELLDAGGEAVESRRLGAMAIAQAAQRGAAVEQAGMLELYAFHFHPDELLGPGVTLSATPRLAPATAVLVGHQVLAFQGARQALRVRARGKDESGAAVAAEAVVPLREPPPTEFGFPLAGRWFIGAGASLHHHHRWVVPEEFALDIARLGEGGVTHRGSGTRRAEYLAYGAEVLAAADGTVRALRDDLVESDAALRRADESDEAYEGRVRGLQMEMMTSGGAIAAAGNYVVIEHPGGLYSFYAHLQPGSATDRVRVGQAVRRGQPIAALGFTGSTTEPHLHFHVADRADPLRGAGVPVTFGNVRLPIEFGPRALQSGDIVEAKN